MIYVDLGVCVVDGWFQQPYLASSLSQTEWTIGLGELFTCCALTNQCVQVKQAITTLSEHFITAC